ncbi:MAG TPA: potassium channel family protein [Candidatus Baltobacteraceae bacterium]|nr:potassium channel family protein [Candidatus Baltobacteraceae bacterium]
MVSAAAVIGGALLVGLTLVDVFQSVIVPRAEDTAIRLSRYLIRFMWRIWPRLAYLLHPRSADRRENFLGIYAPLVLVVVLIAWVLVLLSGWGLIFYGIRDQLHPGGLSFADCVYFAGASLLTIGYGDITPFGMPARVLAVIAAASGLGVVAIVISFLFAIFGSFQRRETFVVTIGARAGVPPSGVGLLEVHAIAGIRSDLAQVFREAQQWTAEVMESHLAYPILVYFRSSHDYESWVGTLGALMDAASLVMSTLDPQRLENVQTRGQARIMYELGRHLVSDFCDYFNLARTDLSAGVERSEFDRACEHLRDEGYDILDADSSWNRFAELRSAYASALNIMARWLEIPPVQWVGDRSMISPHV